MMISIRKGGGGSNPLHMADPEHATTTSRHVRQAQGARHSGNNLPRTCLHMSMISFCQGDRTGRLRSILR